MGAVQEKKQKQPTGRFLDPKADVVFKKIFGQHPDLIKSFLNNLLPLPEGHLIESVKYLTPEQSPRIPEMRNTIVDVKCTDEKGQIFIVEMQMAWSKSFSKRFLFGVSKAYVQQLESGKTTTEAFARLCPVYGLALVNEVFEKATDNWFHHYQLRHKEDPGKIMEGIELILLELPKFNPKTLKDRKVAVLWMRFLQETEGLEDIPEEFKDSPEVLKAIELAQESAYTRDELLAYDAYLDAVRVELTRREDALEEGEQIGLEKGKEEERKKHEEEKKESARKMLAKGLSIEDIREFTGLSVEDIKLLSPGQSAPL